MLTKTQRIRYLKDLGFKGDYKDMLLSTKKRYMNNSKYFITIYNKGTDRMLVSAHRLWQHGEGYFSLKEFQCECGGKYCSGYPAYIDIQLIKNLVKLRKHFGQPITVTCGVRCKKYNASLVGSIPNSKHRFFKAADIYIKGVTDTADGRKRVMAYWYTLAGANYTYCYQPGSANYQMKNATYMGNAVHVDVK